MTAHEKAHIFMARLIGLLLVVERPSWGCISFVLKVRFITRIVVGFDIARIRGCAFLLRVALYLANFIHPRFPVP